MTPQSWEAAFTLIASQSTNEKPSVVVLDEFPYLLESEPNIDAVIPKIWDRHLDKKAPVFLILIGSDLHIMEHLGQYDRPLFGRSREMVVEPLSPADIANMTGLTGADALDAYLICGGFPMLAERWRSGESIWTYLEQELTPTAALIVNAERMLSAEFPTEAQARLILGVIGSGETTFKNISQKSGVNNAGVTRAMDILGRKRAIEIMTPVSAEDAPRNTRYVVADSYLRFWLRFIGPSIGEIERGRAELVLESIRRGWPQYRGQAIEPLVRQALMRMHPPLRRANYVGAYWTRTNDVQVDLVGVEREHGNAVVEFVGSVKWREEAPLDASDVAKLARDRLKVPGATEATPMIAVSRFGFGEVKSLGLKLGPDDLLTAFR
ncbi:MAG: ATP-binding protein [Chloroflexota bacterium]